MKLFRQLIVRPLRRDIPRTVLTLLSIALGVAVVIAIDLAGDAATGSFQSSLTTLLGKVDYEITANGGVDETLVAKLAQLPVNARFSPVIERAIAIAGHGTTTLYGVDALGDDATSVTVSSDLAQRFGWKIGTEIELRGPIHSARFNVKRVIAEQNTGWVGIDIAAAQQLLDVYGKIDRVEVFVGEGESAENVERAIRGVTPATYEVQTPGARSEENRRMLRAFRWNLRVLSYISLLVGAFLIYNTIAVSVVRRRAEIGILRALGTSSRGVLTMFLAEASMLGLIGSALGIALGRLLAAAIVGMISDTVNSIFTTSAPGAITIPLWSAAIAMLTGTSVAFFSALIPALEASRVAPVEAMSRGVREHFVRLNIKRDLFFAAGTALVAIILCQFGPIDGRPLLGYLATLFAVAATAMLSPGFVKGTIHALRGTLKRIPDAAGLIAGRSLSASLARTSIVVTALATAISMMISVGIMVGSFRETVEVWLQGQLRADIFMRAEGPAVAGLYPPIAPEVAEIVEKTPGVAAVDVLRSFNFRYQGTQAAFGGADMEIVRHRRALRFLSGDSDEILASLRGQDRAIVSEPFANKHHVRQGEVLHLPLGDRIAPLTVAGIYYEYSSDRGYVVVDRTTLQKYLPGQPATNIAIYVAPGADKTKVRRDLQDRLKDYPLNIAPNELLRRQAVEIFDRTFAVTYALEAVAILVAMLGAANSLLALVLDRRREIGLIRYLGAASAQIRRMILTEAGLVGLLAGLLGLLLGAALSLVLIYVVNKQSFGWTIQFHPPVLMLGAALLLVWIVTILAGVYPARFAVRIRPIEAVHEE